MESFFHSLVILPYGVMVAREILVLSVWVRALVRQHEGLHSM